MAIPVASFSISSELLRVTFEDLSTNTPTSWLWDFGDAQSSTSQNPIHTYSSPGSYSVQLTSTNADGSDSETLVILVNTTPVLPITLSQFIDLKLPSGVTIDPNLKATYIAQWQLFMQPLVLPAVATVDSFNEYAYTPLANALIASLVARSILIDLGQQIGITTSSTGKLKKLETGPSNAEWYNNADNLKSIFGPGGTLERASSEVCTLSSYIGVYFDFCPKRKTPILFQKSGTNSLNSSLPAPPYTIIIGNQ